MKLGAIRMVGGWNRYLLIVALAKAAIAGAGIALAALASIDFAVAVIAQEALQAWQVDQWINKFALAGGAFGLVLQTVKLIFFR